MAGWKKLLIGAGLLAGAGLVTLIVLVQIFVTPEWVRDQLLVSLQDGLQREVRLGQVEVGLLRGIRLEKLVVEDPGSEEPLLSADRIEISYNLLSILRGRIQFGQIHIMAPRLRLERDADGRLNIADLVNGPAPEKPGVSVESGSAPVAASVEDGSVKKLPLIVDEFLLEGGTLHFVDRSLKTSSAYLYRFEDLSVRVRDFSLRDTFSAQVEGRLNEADLRADILFSFVDGLKELQLHGRKLDLVSLLPYFKESLPGTLHQGLLSADLAIVSEPDLLSVKGPLLLDEIDISIDRGDPLRWKGARLALDNDLSYRFSDNVADVKSLRLDMNGAHLSYAGKVLLEARPQLAGSGLFEFVDLRRLADVLPLEWRDRVTPYSPGGKLQATFQLEGPATETTSLRKLHIEASDLQASFDSLRPSLSGAIDYGDEQLIGKGLVLNLKGQEFPLDLSASQILAPLPVFQLGLSGKLLDLDLLFPAAKDDASAEKPLQKDASLAERPANSVPPAAAGVEPIAASATRSATPQSLPVSGSISLDLDHLRYSGLDFKQLSAKIELHPERVLLRALDAILEGGQVQVSGEARPDQAGFPFKGDYAINKIALAGVADALLPEGKGSISGQLTASGYLQGSPLANDVLAGLQTAGQFDLGDGEVKGSPLFAGLARFLTNPTFEVVSFRRFAGTYSLKAGLGTIDAQLDSRRIRMQPKGSFSLAGPLNLSLATSVSPELVAKSGIGGKGAELLKDDQGWSLLPLKIKGSYSSPKFTLDSRATRQQLKESLGRELGRKLQKKLGTDSDSEGKDAVKELLDGTLKKLFGN